jgi:hypothetical protein
MSALKRIVLLEPNGDLLFEGVSVLDATPKKGAETEAEVDAEPCPPTLRSVAPPPPPSDSGFFAAAVAFAKDDERAA